MYFYQLLKPKLIMVVMLGIIQLQVERVQASEQHSKLGKAIGEQLKSDDISKKGQKKIDGIDEKTQELLDEYRIVLRKIENTKIYNKQMEQLIANQKEEKISLAEQIDSVNVTNQEIVPLMLSMVSTFSKLVKEDIPFLPKERKQRAASLEEMMGRADVSTSEKFRRIMEAYQIENEYGRTLEAYRDEIVVKGDNKKTVDILRVGRVGMYYQSIDGKDQGIWNPFEQSWQELSGSYRRPIRDALRIARKQASPDILTLPIFKQ